MPAVRIETAFSEMSPGARFDYLKGRSPGAHAAREKAHRAKKGNGVPLSAFNARI